MKHLASQLQKDHEAILEKNKSDNTELKNIVPEVNKQTQQETAELEKNLKRDISWIQRIVGMAKGIKDMFRTRSFGSSRASSDTAVEKEKLTPPTGTASRLASL